jgi:hypothetical protein
MDASAQSMETAFQALAKISSASEKFFATADSWTTINPVSDTSIYRIALGSIGRTGADTQSPALNGKIASYIPKLTAALETEKLKPQKFEIFAEHGLEGVPQAVADVSAGKMGGTKCVVKL